MDTFCRETLILLAEDDEAVRAMLRESLAGEGYTVAVARDRFEAVSLLSEIAPDLVLTDYSMPEMNGWDVALYARRRRPGTPVVLITGDCE
jgi:CheY-like chemotaxis protein